MCIMVVDMIVYHYYTSINFPLVRDLLHVHHASCAILWINEQRPFYGNDDFYINVIKYFNLSGIWFAGLARKQTTMSDYLIP